MEMSGWAEGALWRLYFDCCLSGDYWKLTVINLGVGNKDFTSFIYSCRLCLVYDHKKLIENVFLFLSSAEYAIRMREQNNFLTCVITMTNLRWEMNVFHHLKQFDPLSPCYMPKVHTHHLQYAVYLNWETWADRELLGLPLKNSTWFVSKCG